MKTKGTMILVAMLMMIGMTISPTTSRSSDMPNGQYVDDASLIRIYGEYAFEALRRFPNLVETIRQAKGDFKTRDVATSFPTAIFEFNNGKKCVILSGCTPHDCGGTANFIVYDIQSRRAYVFKENRDQNDFRIYGNPDENIKKLLIYHYRNR